MIQPGVSIPWKFYTPAVYRMMEGEYVDRFFETGELMLSSFARFSQHPDEERQDVEGRNIVVGRGPNTTVYAATGHGADAYVLCSTACRPSDALMNAFASNAAIQVFDTTRFGWAVTRSMSNVLQGFEGYCYYTDQSIECKIADLAIDELRAAPGDKALDLNKVGRYILNMAGISVYFKKGTRFRHQMEYRWVWLTSRTVEDTIVVYAPDARKYCLPFPS